MKVTINNSINNYIKTSSQGGDVEVIANSATQHSYLKIDEIL